MKGSTSTPPPPPPPPASFNKAYDDMKSHIPRVVILNDLNYNAWQEVFITHCIVFEVLHHIDGTSTDTSPEWKKVDSMVKYWIYNTITQSLLLQMKDTTTARQLWLSLQHHFQINKTPNQQQPPPQVIRYKYPMGDLLERSGQHKKYVDICIPLYEASMKGDWEAAKHILRNAEYLVRYSVHEHKGTALHIAAMGQSIHFVKNLVDLMSIDDLELHNGNGNTALIVAAIAGNKEMVEIMAKKNNKLLTIRGYLDMLPLTMAAFYRQRHMVTYLYNKCNNLKDEDSVSTNQHQDPNPVWTEKDKIDVFLRCIEADFFDEALQILNHHGQVVVSEAKNVASILRELAQKPHAFDDVKPSAFQKISNSITRRKTESGITESKATELLKKIWSGFAEKPKYEVDRVFYSTQILFIAAELGNIKFLIELIHKYPDVIWMKNNKQQSIFHIAVCNRHHSIFSLLYELGSMTNMITPFGDDDGNLMLHLVGTTTVKSPVEDLSGAAFQMQRELLWFKEVEAMIPPDDRELRNKNGKTPHELFNESHKELLSQAEKWMKETASQCMLVATLITTVVFAVAFTIPGGYNQNTGFPMFLKSGPLITFVILDAISLILSSASILMFLSILTSRYAQKDFLESLPKKLLIGLITLFLSITTMMVSFSVSFFVLYHNNYIIIPIIISFFAIIPIILYAILQYPLLVDAYRSTYGSKYLFKPKKRLLYYYNPSF